MKTIVISSVLLIFIFISLGFSEGGENSLLKNTKMNTDIVRIDVNNIDLQLVNNGRTGNDGNAYYPKGSGLNFLFDGGFATSGFVSGDLRVSWQVSDVLIFEWQPGKWGMMPEDTLARFYVVDQSDNFGSPAYVNWTDAVSLGAGFQDLNGDGSYDPNTDRPDILGSRTIWTVYNDGTPDSVRDLGFFRTQPMGLEIHQTVWALTQPGSLEDVIFFRYRLINADNNMVDSLIFSIFADSDIGGAWDDLTGCDPELYLGYQYNEGSDQQYGADPPAFGIQLIQGPVVDFPGDTAYHYRGSFFGTDTIFDKKNLVMTSYMPYEKNPMPPLSIPEDSLQARIAQIGGLDQFGNPIDPTTWGTGGTPVSDPKFAFNGDPVAGSGWLDDNSRDRRQLLNCGPFQLAAGDTQDIICAYILGRGTDVLDGISIMRQNARAALQHIGTPFITDIKNMDLPVVNRFRLNQNYPNPFNSETTISFSLGKSGEVTLELYNILGSKVSTLVKKRLSSGEHRFRLNMKELPGGIYYYRLTGEESSFTRKMVLIK